MSRTFTRALIINAVLQFVVTRQRAGNALEEGAGEAMWLRYPFIVLANALLWTITLSTLGRIAGVFRRT